MRFCTLDHAYPEAWDALPHATPEEWFEKGCFGTSDFFDVALRAAGHEAITLVRNFYPDLHQMLDAVNKFEPDVVISREAGRFPGNALKAHFPYADLVCTCSHKVDDFNLKGFDVVFSSFPWMVEHCRGLGLRGEYMPLAFGRPVLDRVPYDGPRDIPVCFIGGLGNRTWDQGTKTMAAIAAARPDQFIWHGYVAGNLSDLPAPLQKAYCGPLWGAEMYRTLRRTRIALNRHGEIARGWGNNCRQYEITGCGAFLLTDAKGEFPSAISYYDPTAALQMIDSGLEARGTTEAWAEGMHKYCLEDHCYENRVPKFLEIVESLI